MKFNISNMTVALAAAALGAASCTANYEDINRNPYEVTAEDMERDGYAMRSFMTTMQSWVIPADVNQCQFTDLLLGGPYGGYIADANSDSTPENSRPTTRSRTGRRYFTGLSTPMKCRTSRSCAR